MKNVFESKKRIVVISVILVVLIIVCVLTYSFASSEELTGSFELTVNPELSDSTDNEAENSSGVFYVFEKPDQYGKGEWMTIYDGGIEKYEYQLSEDNGIKKVNLGSVDLEYKITGSKLFKNQKLTLIYPEQIDEETGEKMEAQEYVLIQKSAPDYEKESYDKYETNEKLLGEWATNERTLAYYFYSLPYMETIEFKDNGLMVIRYQSDTLALDRYMYYAYTANDNAIEFSLVTDKDSRCTVGYTFDENNNLKFTDDETDISIFADQVFGGYTYYRLENLPEATIPVEIATEQ